MTDESVADSGHDVPHVPDVDSECANPGIALIDKDISGILVHHVQRLV